MDCIKCEGKTKVNNTIKFAGYCYRHRICLICKNDFWTEENEVENYTDIKHAIAYRQANYRARRKEQKQ